LLLTLNQEVARAWALADAKAIILVGRNRRLLNEPVEAIRSINPATEVLALTTDLTSQIECETLFKQAVSTFGTVDVVVHAAAAEASGSIGDISPDAWFAGFEVNVKGTYIVAHEYLRVVPKGGTIIILGTLGASLTVPGMSAYSASKLALLKVAEFLDIERTELRVFTVHPGIVMVTESGRGAIVDALTPFAKDKGIQTGGLSLYLAQPRANYLRGCFVSVNCKSASYMLMKGATNM
jgi:NAD(P)-dependent dehydrogenase (short-subunit alcohol dehydrogenase family)